jgi:hypothetical protein
VAGGTGADLLWRVRSNQKFPCHRRLPDGSFLSRLRPSFGPHRRQRAVVVRVIEYRLDGVPDAEPLYRLITSRLDPESAPAAELAALYHERWEEEGAFAELKVTLPGRQLMLRSRRADLAEQELYALLLVHLALRGLMVQASRQGPGHAVVHPHGAAGPASSSLPRRLFPLGSANAWLSGS